ncbi:MAG: hypothetical protein ACEQSR_15370, partial [Candidatus Methylacidiphilales bacterium]
MLNFKYLKTASLVLSVIGFINLQARENIGLGKLTGKSTNVLPNIKSNPLSKMGAGCSPATAQKELSI